MAGKKVSALDAANTPDGTEKLHVVQGGADKAMTTGQIATMASAGVAAAVTSAMGDHTAAPDPHPDYMTQSETEALITAAVNALLDGTPGALDTLNELAAALGDDANFAATVTTALAAKLGAADLASQAEAEAGTNNAKWMSPLRVAQAIAALAGSGTMTWRTATASGAAVLGDANNGVQMDVATANDFTVPPNSSVAIPVGKSIMVMQKGAGQTTLVAGSGVTLLVDSTLSLKLARQNAVVSLLKVATDTWVVAGNLEVTSGGGGGGSTQGLHQLSIPAGAWYSDATDPPIWDVASGASGFPSTQNWGFIDTAEKAVYTFVRMPKAWNAGTVTFSVDWRDNGTGGAGGVVWSLRGVALGDGDSFTGTGYGTAQTSTDANGTANQLRRSPVSAAITIAGSPAKEDLIVLELRRKTGDAGDTASIYAHMLNVTLNYTTDADTDA